MLHNKWCVCAAQSCHIRPIISHFESNFSISCSGYLAITDQILYNTVVSSYNILISIIIVVRTYADTF